jgi:hypothetical protein
MIERGLKGLRALLGARDPAVGAHAELERLLLALGRQESRWVRAFTCDRISQAEFRIFSQWGEDGIIQYLLGKVPIENPVFVEFGVQDYRESNTRFLLANDDWRGLVLDSGDGHRRFLASDPIGWRHDIRAVTAFVTAENANQLISGAGVSGDVGLLSIDIDGNDYWVLRAIGCVSPRILVVEYNSVFGRDRAVTIPYHPRFDRTRAHYSNLYFGASLAAICEAARAKGYAFVGSNSAGCNAFFVRRDVLGQLRELSPAEGWVESRFRQSRDRQGRLSYLADHQACRAVMRDMPLVEVPSGRELRVGDI